MINPKSKLLFEMNSILSGRNHKGHDPVCFSSFVDQELMTIIIVIGLLHTNSLSQQDTPLSQDECPSRLIKLQMEEQQDEFAPNTFTGMTPQLQSIL